MRKANKNLYLQRTQSENETAEQKTMSENSECECKDKEESNEKK